MSLKSYANSHPMAVFWLGLLAGVLIVGLCFFYRTLDPADYNTAIIKNSTSIGDPMGRK